MVETQTGLRSHLNASFLQIKEYLKAKKYLEVYVVADNTLVSMERTCFSHFTRYAISEVQPKPLGSYRNHCPALCFTSDLGQE